MMSQRVTARQVLDFLIEKGILTVLEDEPGIMNNLSFQSALRCVQRYLNRRGFARGRKKGAISIRLQHIAWRNRHIRLLYKYRSMPFEERLQEVYLDESYIHQHYAQVDDSLYDPTDSEYREPKKEAQRKTVLFPSCYTRTWSQLTSWTHSRERVEFLSAKER